MRELLVTMTLISLVSSKEFEPKKRFGIPPEEDPNFWPTRGKRGYWNNPRLFGNSISRDNSAVDQDVDYSGRSRSWGSENDDDQGIFGYPNTWKYHLCPRKKSISLVLPLQELNPEETEIGGRCSNEPAVRGRDRRGGERWRNQPLYAEEPSWISIDFNGGVLRNTGTEIPFIVARGRKRNEEFYNLRGIRQLDDVLNSYENPDPFFVARGKRELNKKSEGTSNEFKSKSQVKSMNDEKRASNSEEEAEVSSSSVVDRKFFKTQPVKRSEDDLDGKKFALTKPMTVPHSHQRSQRSSTDNVQSDDGDWTMSSDMRQVAAPKTNQEFQVVKTRYSRPRDKHSNLQSMLDEPFFISRGKKNNEQYLNEDEDFEEDYIINAPKFQENIYRLKKKFDDDDDDVDNNENFKSVIKSLRNRRGMLDELLKSDDPFYVARGKKLYNENVPVLSEYFDIIAKDAANEAAAAGKSRGKFSIYSKSTKTKLLQKLYDSSKIFNHPDFYKFQDDSSNFNDNQNNDVN